MKGRRLMSQMDDFDQDINIGNAANNRQQNVVVNEGTVDQEIANNHTNSNSTTNENVVNMNNSELCFSERIDREMGNIVGSLADLIQNANSTAIDSFYAPTVELAVRPINASSRYDATIATAASYREK